MDEHRDDLDAWLATRIQPLLPRPGTFDRVQSRARRRRIRRAVVSAASAAALVAVAAVVVPQVVTGALHAGREPSGSGGAPGQRGTRSAGPSAGPGPAASRVPPPLSVTFVGTNTGWVMGQASPAGQCDLAAAHACLVLRRTDTAGSTWYTVNPPPGHGPDGGTGVSQIRFLNLSDGWAFGPQLLATHDGGQTWTQIPTGGLRVTALEARGSRVFAVWANCAGTGPDFAARCTNFRVYSSPAGSDHWAPVTGPPSSAGPGGAASAASLALTSVTAYALTPGAGVLSGAVAGGPWQRVSGPGTPVPAPCRAGPAQPDGQPARALLTITAPSDLAVLCTSPVAGGGQRKTLYSSRDGGRTWHATGNAPTAGTAASLSGSPSGALVLATSQAIEVSADGGATWTAATVAAPPGGFSYVGMTTSMQGIAVPADPGQHGVWFTYNGARSWQESAVGE